MASATDRTAVKPLMALALAAFGIGTTEFIIMGLLPDVARSLGITIPAAGLLVSGYALGVAFGGPLLALLTARLPGRRALFLLLGLFIVGNIACALAPTYGALMAARVVTAFCHAAFLGVGSVIAASLVPSGKRARAIAMMIGGLTVATVIGLPLGTLIGQVAGWRITFWAVTATGILAFVGLWHWLEQGSEKPRDLLAELRALRAISVWLVLAISVVASISMFTFFTYITPILTGVSGIEPAHVSGVLFVCGLGLTAGNFIGARLADWRSLPSLAVILLSIAVVLIGFSFIGPVPLLAISVIVVWSIVAFAVCAILQAEVVGRAGDAPNLAATLNIAAFNLGNALGAGLGAWTLARGLPLSDIPVLAAAVALFALALTGVAIFAMRKQNNKPCCSAA